MKLDEIVRETERGVLITIHAVPRSSRNELAGTYGDALRIRVTAPPVKGSANSAVVTFLADGLRVPSCQVEVVAGHGSRRKLVAIAGVSKRAVLEWLATAL